MTPVSRTPEWNASTESLYPFNTIGAGVSGEDAAPEHPHLKPSPAFVNLSTPTMQGSICHNYRHEDALLRPECRWCQNPYRGEVSRARSAGITEVQQTSFSGSNMGELFPAAGLEWPAILEVEGHGGVGLG